MFIVGTVTGVWNISCPFAHYKSGWITKWSSGGGRSKILMGTGTKKLGLRGFCFGPFVFCLWIILLLFLIFLSFSWCFSPIFLCSQNFRRVYTPLKILEGETSPLLPPPVSGPSAAKVHQLNVKHNISLSYFFVRCSPFPRVEPKSSYHTGT